LIRPPLAGYQPTADMEESIVEFEGFGKNLDLTRWSQFTDIKDIRTEMFKRLDSYFNQWLNV
jgi:hypothetical protein